MCGFFLSGYDRERNNKRNWGYVEMKIKNPSTQDILNMDIEDIESLSRTEIAKIVSQVASAGNKRIKNLQNKGLTSEALIDVYKSGGKFSVKGKNKTELLNELKREKQFFSGDSTVLEVKATNKSIIEKLEESGALEKERANISDEDITKEFWKAMDMLRETNPALFVNDCLLYGDDVYSEISKGKSANEVFSEITERIENDNAEMIEKSRETKSNWDKLSGWDI